MTRQALARSSRRRAVLLVAILLAAAPPCQSQAPLIRQALDSGQVVRLHSLSGLPEAGRLTAPFARDSTTFRYCLYYAAPCRSAADAQWRQRLASEFSQLEVKVGSHAGRGFLIGTAVCGVAWALVSPIVGGPDWTDNPANFLVGFVTGAIISAPGCGGMGALIGGQKPVWGPAPE